MSMFDMKEFVQAVRTVMSDVHDVYPSIEWELYQPIVVEIDAEQFVLGRLPIVFGAMMVLIFIVIAAVYRAAFVPIKLTLTLLLPIFAIYGEIHDDVQAAAALSSVACLTVYVST